MTRPRTPHDRVVKTASVEPALFRVVGVEPHGWSTVLIEDNGGRCYVAVTATGKLTEIRHVEAQRLIRNRIYRRWLGDRSWTELERMPLLATEFTQQTLPLDTDSGNEAY